MREKYIEQLEDLNEEILNMGSMAEKILDMTITALLNHDIDLACKVIEFEKEIDKKESELDEKCLQLIALQQPLAGDLRRVAAIIKMISDLERIGDLSENIAEIVVRIGKEKFIKPLVDIPKMAEITKEMIKSALDCFVKEDINLAYKVFTMDDIVDNIYKEIYMELLYMISKNSNIINQAIDLLFIGRYLERIADHATNICEYVNYMVTGNKRFNTK